MKLAKNTELVILGVLIAYIAFFPRIPLMRDLLSTPVGKALALAGIVYVGKTTSLLIAVLLAVAYLRCTSGSIWEGFSGAEDTCLCAEEGFTWDGATKKCKNAEGLEGKVKSCTCMSGYSWDGGEKGTQQCVPTSGEQPPIPPVATPVMTPPVTATEAAPSTAAPAVSSGPVTSTAPMTTPSATQSMVTSAPPMSAGPTEGVQPTMGPTVSTPAAM